MSKVKNTIDPVFTQMEILFDSYSVHFRFFYFHIKKFTDSIFLYFCPYG